MSQEEKTEVLKESVSLDLVFVNLLVCSFVCFDFNIGTFLTLQKNKMMRKVRSIKSDDTEEWYKEADFKFKMLRGGRGGGLKLDFPSANQGSTEK